VTENACTPAVGDPKCDYKSDSAAWPTKAGVQYYGRGPFQLSWNYNYGAFSEVLTGDKTTLLNDPDQVQTSGYTAFLSALYYYMSPSAPKPSMHEVATKLYVPNTFDSGRGLGPFFGASTMIINGGLECTTADG